MKLSKEQKEKLSTWVEELRSGKFKQGTSALYDSHFKEGESFCCLGVLGITQLESEEEKQAFKEICMDEDADSGYLYELSSYSTTPFEKDIIEKVNSVELEEDFQEVLAKLNDGASKKLLMHEYKLKTYFPKSTDSILDLVGKNGEVKLTFEQIADCIEKDYLL